MAVTGLGFQNPASLYADNIRLNSNPVNKSPQNFTDAIKRAAADSALGKHAAEEPIDKEDQLYQLCLELETFLVKNLLTSMRNTVQKSGLVDDSFAGKMYEDMLYEEYAKDFTKNAGFGLAEQAYRQLKNL
jgi:flagellar protein FlgJ